MDINHPFSVIAVNISSSDIWEDLKATIFNSGSVTSSKPDFIIPLAKKSVNSMHPFAISRYPSLPKCFSKAQVAAVLAPVRVPTTVDWLSSVR